jgi:uncharacterized small protein (DUF1192 family)
MAFTREEMAAYEAKPQLVVPDPVLNASPAAVAQETSQETPAAEAESSTAEASDQTESGDETSDETEATSTSSATDDESEVGETEGEQAEGDESEAEASAEGEESTDQPTKPISRASKRIQELNSKKVEAEDLAEGYKEFGRLAQEQLKRAQEEIDRLKAGTGKPAATKPAPETQEPKLGPMPKLTDPEINFDPDILAEKTAEWVEKKIKLGVSETLQQTTKQAAEKSEAQKVVDTFTSRIEDFKKDHKDWDTKVKNPALPRLHPAAQAIIVKAALGPAITYHLGSNLEEAQRIAALEPEEQAAEIGAIRAELAKEAKAKPAANAGKDPVTGAKPVTKKSVSQAPPPPTPVPAGKRSAERDATDPTMDMDNFARKHREGKNNARLASRRLRGLQ